MKLNNNVVPNELVIGKSGSLCFITYMRDGKLSHEKSFKQWSDNGDSPDIIKNVFQSGFKVSGINKRWSRQAKNKEVCLITHPSVDLDFEISWENFMEICHESTITKGLIDIPLIISYNKELLSERMYESRVKSYYDNIEDAKERETQFKIDEKRKWKVVSGKNQFPGRLYVRRGSNVLTVYLGTALNENNELRHYYMSGDHFSSYLDNYYPFSGKWFEEHYEGRGTWPINKVNPFYKEYPIIIAPRDSKTILRASGIKNKASLRLPRNPRPESDFDKNIFDFYSDSDWEKIYEVCYKLNIKPNFREEYLALKAQ